MRHCAVSAILLIKELHDLHCLLNVIGAGGLAGYVAIIGDMAGLM
jgi:hypothetical protein